MRWLLLAMMPACAAPEASPRTVASLAVSEVGCTPRLLASVVPMTMLPDASLEVEPGAELELGVTDGEVTVAPRAAPGWRATLESAVVRAQLARTIELEPSVVALAGTWVVVDEIHHQRAGVVGRGDRVDAYALDAFVAEIVCADLAEHAISVAAAPVPRTPRRVFGPVDLHPTGHGGTTLEDGQLVDVLQVTPRDARVRAVVDGVVMTGWIPCDAVSDIECLAPRIGLLRSPSHSHDDPEDEEYLGEGGPCEGVARLRAHAPLFTAAPASGDAQLLPSVDRAVAVALVDADGDARRIGIVSPAPAVARAYVWVRAADLDRPTCR